jgi:hypothetical protein
VATLVTQGVTHGKQAVLLRFPPGHTEPTFRWEAPATDALQDWSGFDRLAVDVLNLEARQVLLRVTFQSGRDGSGSYSQVFVLGPQESRTLAIDLARARVYGLEHGAVSRLEFSMYRLDNEVRVVVDHIRLEKIGRPPASDPPGGG